jgi:DNA invertase Pin-like site-specific DNA recombinase
MKTAIYARVSTRDGRQDTENQLRQLREFAASQGWTVVHEYVDRASGKRGDREQFQKMYAAASKREFDCVLFWSLDCLSREGTVETLNHLQRLTGYSVNYRSFTEQYLDSTGIFKEAVIGILAAVAKQERVRLSERTTAGLQRARAQGRVGGRPKAEDSEPRLVANIARLRSHGHSIRAIAAEVGKSANTVIRLLKDKRRESSLMEDAAHDPASLLTVMGARGRSLECPQIDTPCTGASVKRDGQRLRSRTLPRVGSASTRRRFIRDRHTDEKAHTVQRQ